MKVLSFVIRRKTFALQQQLYEQCAKFKSHLFVHWSIHILGILPSKFQ
jgi:hypothetical protein